MFRSAFLPARRKRNGASGVLPAGNLVVQDSEWEAVWEALRDISLISYLKLDSYMYVNVDNHLNNYVHMCILI